jgi:hypothetical protein
MLEGGGDVVDGGKVADKRVEMPGGGYMVEWRRGMVDGECMCSGQGQPRKSQKATLDSQGGN